MSIATMSSHIDTREQEHHGNSARVEEWLDLIGPHSVRYGLVVVLLWIGAMKFTAYEAEGISGLVANSPLTSWAYQVFSTRQFSALLGTVELAIAGLIAIRFWSPRASAIGSFLAAGMFVTTLSFLFSTPGVVEGSVGFPAISVLPGQFLIKDVVLLGAALWTAGEALRTAKQNAVLNGAALRGYDPVAYFTDQKPARGDVAFSSTHDGQRYHFRSQEHKELFDRSPEQYLPQYGGHCAFGVAMGQLFDVDPRTGQAIDGKLYLNLNRKILADFNKDAEGYIRKADDNWPELSHQQAA